MVVISEVIAKVVFLFDPVVMPWDKGMYLENTPYLAIKKGLISKICGGTEVLALRLVYDIVPLADTVRGPVARQDELARVLKDLGFVAVAPDSVSWREPFAEYADEELPAVSLRAARRREGLTQKNWPTFPAFLSAYFFDGAGQDAYRGDSG